MLCFLSTWLTDWQAGKQEAYRRVRPRLGIGTHMHGRRQNVLSWRLQVANVVEMGENDHLPLLEASRCTGGSTWVVGGGRCSIATVATARLAQGSLQAAPSCAACLQSRAGCLLYRHAPAV